MSEYIKGFDRHVVKSACFTPDELQLIIDEANKEMQDGTISGKNDNSGIRRSKVHWLNKQKFKWVYDKIWDVVEEVNTYNFGFDVEKFEGRLQVARYHAEDEGFYTWHMDNGAKTPGRKISISVQLSDPNDYEGGNLELFYTNKAKTAARDQGAIVAFPSWVMHRVTPVTKGIRYSMVAWIVGDRWC